MQAVRPRLRYADHVTLVVGLLIGSFQTLEIILFYLLDDAAKLERFRAELVTVMPHPTSPILWKQLQSLTYMVSVVD